VQKKRVEGKERTHEKKGTEYVRVLGEKGIELLTEGTELKSLREEKKKEGKNEKRRTGKLEKKGNYGKGRLMLNTSAAVKGNRYLKQSEREKKRKKIGGPGNG